LGLIVSKLLDVKSLVERSGADHYKQFWNVDSNGKTENPRPENECRNYAMQLLTPMVEPYGVRIAREASYRSDTRADLEASKSLMKVPIEAKRHYHDKLWTAIPEQLVEQYASDPETDSTGILLVFWFGTSYPIRPSPLGVKPSSVHELRSLLEGVIPKTHTIEVVVLDCTK
jgi:hypothetical protein